jgi:hypothetical protein
MTDSLIQKIKAPIYLQVLWEGQKMSIIRFLMENQGILLPTRVIHHVHCLSMCRRKKGRCFVCACLEEVLWWRGITPIRNRIPKGKLKKHNSRAFAAGDLVFSVLSSLGGRQTGRLFGSDRQSMSCKMSSAFLFAGISMSHHEGSEEGSPLITDLETGRHSGVLLSLLPVPYLSRLNNELVWE